MPLYTYTCKDCLKEQKLFKSVSGRMQTSKCECGGEAEYTLPSNTTAEITEIKDPWRGKKVRKDVDKQLLARMRDHHDKYEIQEKVDRHGLETAEKHKWTTKIKRS